MNCPSRTDEPPRSDGLNQSPNALSNDLTTNQDLNGLANARRLRRTPSLTIQSAGIGDDPAGVGVDQNETDGMTEKTAGKAGARVAVALSATERASETPRVLARSGGGGGGGGGGVDGGGEVFEVGGNGGNGGSEGRGGRSLRQSIQESKSFLGRMFQSLKTFYHFVGPGFIVSVAYIDPGNYSTDIAAGASYRFRLLFIVLLSNLFAIFLQSLCIKLGTVSGRNLAEACRAFLPRWLNYILYVFGEVAIIATDIAEVIGTAIALNLLQPKIPLVAGCAISIVDVFVVLFFFRADSKTAQGSRVFEIIVAPLVLGVVICFCIQLSYVHETADVGSVFRGYVPSSQLIEQKALYQACGILGATVMPHSLYLGSGIVQPRLRDFDRRSGLMPEETVVAPRHHDRQQQHRWKLAGKVDESQTHTYIPSLAAIQFAMKYSIAELAISLFTFALFVNSAILIVAGAALYNNDDAADADIFAIHDLLSRTVSKAAGIVFALALLLSGLSAGIVCTVAGQLVSEGALQWTMAPWLRRLLTRSISIMPSIIIAGAVGRTGLDRALNASQVVLSIVLPFVSAPLLWFTCFNKYMTVQPGGARMEERKRYMSRRQRRRQADREAAEAAVATEGQEVPPELPVLAHDDMDAPQPVKMANSWPVVVLGVVIWLFIAVMNVANLVLLGLGGGD